jgi:hypothetical protein
MIAEKAAEMIREDRLQRRLAPETNTP